MVEPQCRGTTKAGRRCRSPFADHTGLCPAHRPGGKADMVARAKRGAAATARRHRGGGLLPEDLGTLDTVEDGQRWLRAIVTAVGERRLTHSEGQAMVAGVREWLRAQDTRARVEQLAELQEEVKRLKQHPRRAS